MNDNLSYIEVLKPGISSIQDGGRFGYLSQGIPIAGFMDSKAAGLANMLVGNTPGLACIEWTGLSPKLCFKEAAIIAITGVQVDAYVNKIKVKTYKSIRVPKNGILSFGAIKQGVYGYISISKGFKTEKVLGSRSWFPQITKHHLFTKGINLAFISSSLMGELNSKLAFKNDRESKIILKAFPGPEFNLLEENQKVELVNSVFTISSVRSRMGIQLKESFGKHDFSIFSSPVLPGTVQWTPSGNLIILMKDAQTIGGYPRVLQLSENALIKLVSCVGVIEFSI